MIKLASPTGFEPVLPPWTVKQQVLEQGLIIEQEKILPNGEIELVVCERY